jgi:hypothetical protein
LTGADHREKGRIPDFQAAGLWRRFMTLITIKFTQKELELLTALASDQLFRREFIDPRLPGYKPVSGELNLGKSLVERLRASLDPIGSKRAATARIAG